LLQDKLTLDPGGVTKLKHEFRGAESLVEVGLAPKGPGIEIDPRSGELTIDGPALVETVAKALASWTTSTVYPSSSASETLEGESNEYPRGAKQRFQRIVGRPAKGVPVLVPIGLVARDKSQQIARLNYQIFLEVPEDQAREAFRRRNEESRKRQEEAARQLAEAKRKATAVVERVESPSDLPKRVEEIEKRLSRLEAQIERLTRLLTKSQEEPAPKPPNK
jgi:hypothetical protein